MKILITGITGQDGIFLTKHLLSKNANVEIVGISRNSDTSNFLKFAKISSLENHQKLILKNINLLKLNEVSNFIKDFSPDYLFNLSGPSSVYESLKDPRISEEIKLIFNNLTSSLIEQRNFCRFFQASSSEMYGNHFAIKYLNEDVNFSPNSPYAMAKLENHKMVKSFNEKYFFNIYSGIIFNHESEYIKDSYLFMKIINSAYEIKLGNLKSLTLGSLDVIRDWSYAGDIAKGIYQLTTSGKFNNYVLGSGTGTSIKEVVKIVFELFELDYKSYIRVDENLLRPNDPKSIISDPQRIEKEIGWKTTKNIEYIINKIIDNKKNH